MHTEKRLNFKYLFTILLVLILSAVLLLYISYECEKYTEIIDDEYRTKSEHENFLVPSAKGNAMGLDYVYDIKNAEGNKLIIFGASTSIAGVDDTVINGYSVLKACSGSAGINSLFVMKEYINDAGVCISSDDIVKMDISVTTFKNTAFENEVLVSALTKGDVYSISHDNVISYDENNSVIVDSDAYTVERNNLFPVRKELVLRTRSIEKAIQYAKEKIINGSYDNLFTANEVNFKTYNRLLSFDYSKLELIKSFIKSFDGKFIVEIIYESEAFSNSRAGKKYDAYIDDYVIPYLIQNDIPYIDNRRGIPEECYIDGIHINASGRKMYTQIIEEYIRGMK